MWTRAVLLFALCLGFYARGETFCEGGSYKACQTWFNSRPTFPKTEEDVLDICPKILSHLESVQNFVANCGNQDVAHAESLPKFKIYLTDVCKEDSKTRAGIVKELPCLNDALRESNGTCLKATREAMANYLEENKPDYGDSLAQSKYECFYLIALVACMEAEFDVTCGTGAKDVLLDAYIRTGYLEESCKENKIDEVLKLVSILELEFELKERIGSVLHTYREFLSLEEVPENRYKRHARRSIRRLVKNKEFFFNSHFGTDIFQSAFSS